MKLGDSLHDRHVKENIGREGSRRMARASHIFHAPATWANLAISHLL